MTIQYKLTVGNSGGLPLTSVTVSDSTGSTGCAFPTTLAVGAIATPCLYTRTAPTVTGGGITADYTNLVTVDSSRRSRRPIASPLRLTSRRPGFGSSSG